MNQQEKKIVYRLGLELSVVVYVGNVITLEVKVEKNLDFKVMK